MAETELNELETETGAEETSGKDKRGGKKLRTKKPPVEDFSTGSGDDQGRMKALEATLADLTKRFGDGTVVRLGDANHLAVEVIPTGSLTVDIATGVGGVPRGRIACGAVIGSRQPHGVERGLRGGQAPGLVEQIAVKDLRE